MTRPENSYEYLGLGLFVAGVGLAPVAHYLLNSATITGIGICCIILGIICVVLGRTRRHHDQGAKR